MTAGSDASGSSLAAPETEALRLLALEAAAQAGSNEDERRLISAAAPLLGVLFRKFLTHDIQTPDWPDRDRFLISPSMQPLACALLHLLGRGAAANGNGVGEGPKTEAPANAAKEAPATSPAGEGTACDLTPRGLDLPLNLPGHGLAAAVGMAMAARLLRERFGAEVFDHATWALIDDRDVEPGVAQESIAIAPWLMPHKLVVLHLTAVHDDGSPHGRQRCPNHLARFAAAGWHVQQARADDEQAIAEALRQALEEQEGGGEQARPFYIAVEYLADETPPQATALRNWLGWGKLAEGEVPGEVRDEWRLAGLRGRKARRAWQQRVDQLDEGDQQALARRLEQPLPEDFRQDMRALRAALAEQAQERDLQGMLGPLLSRAAQYLPEMMVLTALHGELPAGEALPAMPEDDAQAATAAGMRPLDTLDLGLRPMALAALLTGMAAHGGVRPVGVALRHQLGQMLPVLGEAARAGAVFGLFVLETARCHQAPMEALPPGVQGLFPADAVELVECWQLCVQQPVGPALIFVPHGARPTLRDSVEKSNLCALGGYEIYSAEETPRAVVFAAGRSLSAALEAAHVLEQGGVPVRVVSLPAPQRLMRQEEAHRRRIAGMEAVRVLAAPGRVSNLWAWVLGGGEVVSPCAEDGVLLDDRALATLIRQGVRARLESPLLDTARQEAAGGEAAERPGGDSGQAEENGA